MGQSLKTFTWRTLSSSILHITSMLTKKTTPLSWVGIIFNEKFILKNNKLFSLSREQFDRNLSEMSIGTFFSDEKRGMVESDIN